MMRDSSQFECHNLEFFPHRVIFKIEYSFVSHSSSEDDEDGEDAVWEEDEGAESDVSWADLARSYRSQLRAARRRARAERGEPDDDTESDTATIGASDADCDTDTETEMETETSE